MTAPRYDRHQAVALADLIRTVRPAWDALVLVDVLAELTDRPLPDVARHALRIAAHPSARTPRALLLDWTEEQLQTTWTPPSHRDACPTHPGGHRGRCAGCRADELAATT